MKRIIRFVAALCIGLTSTSVMSQEYPDWEGFPPMFTIQDMIEYNGVIYCACKGGLYRYDSETQEYTLYYKNHGLLGNNVLALDATTDFIYLGFKDFGLVQFDPETEEYEKILFPEYTASNPPIEIKSIFAYNDSILYIGHSKGVDKINIATKELRTFSNLGTKIKENTSVNDVKVLKNKIWACTEIGIAVADVDDPDLEFESTWKNYSYLGSRFNVVEHINDQWDSIILFGLTRDGIAYFDEEGDKIESYYVTRETVYDFTQTEVKSWAAGDKGLYEKYVKYIDFQDSDYRNVRAVIGDIDDNLWVGTMNQGLQYYYDKSYQPVPPVSGPRNSKFQNIDIADNGVLWISTGDRDQNMDALFLRFDDGVWTEYSDDDGVLRDTVDAVEDNKGNIWLAHWGKGLFLLQDDGTPDKENDVVVHIDPVKEFIKPTLASWYVVCSDLVKDMHGNIWIANHQVTETTSGPVVVDGYPITKRQTYSPGEDGLATAEIYHMDADDEGWLWLATASKGLIALYVGDDPFDKSDMYVKNLTLADGLLGMDITAVGHDMDGDIWVGTKGGLNRVKKLSGKRLKVEDVNALIGKGVEISCIDVDDSNNKWIGTKLSGLFKLDSNNDLAAHYIPDNSGIFSKTISSLKYDNSTDVLWIGTDTGLNKFYVLGVVEEEKDTDIHLYPNPFEIWGTDSIATFPNLKQQSHVRIYDFGGELVNELIAGDSGDGVGASAVWNGENFKMETVASGVYFFTGTDLNGFPIKDKMVVIRR
ncbi:hypothetical protein ACFL60_03530 [Candidatus Omnitrophota bacterium]